MPILPGGVVSAATVKIGDFVYVLAERDRAYSRRGFVLRRKVLDIFGDFVKVEGIVSRLTLGFSCWLTLDGAEQEIFGRRDKEVERLRRRIEKLLALQVQVERTEAPQP